MTEELSDTSLDPDIPKASITSSFIALATFASMVLVDLVAYLSNRRRNA